MEGVEIKVGASNTTFVRNKNQIIEEFICTHEYHQANRIFAIAKTVDLGVEKSYQPWDD